MGKHVIILGAGASHGSGYPLANDLRLLISSSKHWEYALASYEDKNKLAGRPITTAGMTYWNKHADALNLFRNGGFATIDEFCKLAGGFSFQKEIDDLRCLVRAALGLFNPEEHFEKSEYYGFVQALFKKDLLSLREDIVVLTFNYDPYLEFLLYRALEHRWKVTRKGKSIIATQDDLAKSVEFENNLNAITSGFYNCENQTWLGNENTKPNFCVLKLHGSICYYADDVTSYDSLFSGSPKERAEKLFAGNANRVLPPIIFPWEIMTDRGFIEKDSFPLKQNRSLYFVFRSIWERARREVQSASKVSFVGLSMHSFLYDSMKYLFEGKEGKTEFVIANPANSIFVPNRTETHWNHLPHSPAFTLARDVLDKIPTKMKMIGKATGQNFSDGDITLVKDFTEFVRTQMKPI